MLFFFNRDPLINSTEDITSPFKIKSEGFKKKDVTSREKRNSIHFIVLHLDLFILSSEVVICLNILVQVLNIHFLYVKII